MRIVLVALLLLPLGCMNGRPERELAQHDRGEMGPPDPDCIEISAGSSSGIYGGAQVSARWVLQKNGKSTGTITYGHNAGSLPAETKHFEAPPEVFAECTTLLRETSFFRMPQRNEPALLFENSASDICVKWNGRKHCVLIVHPAPAPAGFDQLQRFVNGLPERSWELK